MEFGDHLLQCWCLWSALVSHDPTTVPSRIAASAPWPQHTWLQILLISWLTSTITSRSSADNHVLAIGFDLLQRLCKPERMSSRAEDKSPYFLHQLITYCPLSKPCGIYQISRFNREVARTSFPLVRMSLSTVEWGLYKENTEGNDDSCLKSFLSLLLSS